MVNHRQADYTSTMYSSGHNPSIRNADFVEVKLEPDVSDKISQDLKSFLKTI